MNNNVKTASIRERVYGREYTGGFHAQACGAGGSTVTADDGSFACSSFASFAPSDVTGTVATFAAMTCSDVHPFGLSPLSERALHTATVTSDGMGPHTSGIGFFVLTRTPSTAMGARPSRPYLARREKHTKKQSQYGIDGSSVTASIQTVETHSRPRPRLLIHMALIVLGL